jgi:RNA polymerase sigma factor (sigma-70 family)
MSAFVRRARAADFDRVYRRHAHSIYRYAYAVLGNHADAEDVTQQTFIRAYRAIAQGTTPRKAKNWLLTIAHNELRRHFRRASGRPLEVELDERLEQPASERPDPSLSEVLLALQQLPPRQRTALVMREFEGRSHREMAQILGVSQDALEGLIFRARRGLEKHLRGTEERRRSALKGLSVLPVPASLLAFRAETALAAGSAAAGGTGLASGIAAKAAAVAATAAVAGGVGYVATRDPAPGPKSEPIAARATVPDFGDRHRALGAKRAVVRGQRRPLARPVKPSRAKAPRVRRAAKPKAFRTLAQVTPVEVETRPPRQATSTPTRRRARPQRDAKPKRKSDEKRRADEPEPERDHEPEPDDEPESPDDEDDDGRGPDEERD